tara:strand:- start:54 stop:449 length:396 start_codon:yes stop_codon:yes gene_type:complete
MTNKIATILSEIQIPNNKWYSSPNGLKTRKEEIDPLLISLDNLRRQVKVVEKQFKKQLQLRREKHNYKQIWLGFDNAYKDKKPHYMTTSVDSYKRFPMTWVKQRGKNLKILNNNLNKINKMLEVYINQSVQ